ncbi:type II secretion system F family protein [Candidatus Woesearchaeota archaeon]|nr:type II secretion system F family protein [Candidatus Woesearchaeota archaeon]
MDGKQVSESRKEDSDNPKKGPRTRIGLFIAKRKEELEKYRALREKHRELAKKRKEKIKRRRKHMLRRYLDKAGINVEEEKVTNFVFRFCIVINVFILIYLVYFFAFKVKLNFFLTFILVPFLWVLIFVLVVFIVWLMFYITLDFRIFKRKLSMEDVLADFLQLTSANIRAGMPIDKALWFSVRPRFGVLANEIEIVAKETMSGKDLDVALTDFTHKYDSPLLKRSVSLLIEGLRAGGEVGDLLNRISSNISESRIMRKEMSSNVTTYVIFITFATVIAAPILFALSKQLLTIIDNLINSISRPSIGIGGFASAFSSSSIQPADFTIFAVAMIIITSIFSATIVAIIRKGSLKAGFKYLPTFTIVSIILYYFADWVLTKMLGGILI